MNRRSLAGFSATVLVCALNHPTGAAEPGEVRIRYAPYRPPSAVISVETNLVELGVTVRDRKGAPIGGLQASDFQVFDNLTPQIVTSFSERRAEPALARGAAAGFSNPLLSAIPPAGAVVAAAPPRTIALFFDDTHSGLAGFDRSKHAAQKMIADGLGPGDRVGINRAGYFVVPMDEALAVVAVDLGGRPYLVYRDKVKTRLVGDLQSELLEDFFQGFVTHAGANLHARILSGRSNHHKVEAIFKCFARAMRYACSKDARLKNQLPSTKGLL